MIYKLWPTKDRVKAMTRLDLTGPQRFRRTRFPLSSFPRWTFYQVPGSLTQTSLLSSRPPALPLRHPLPLRQIHAIGETRLHHTLKVTDLFFFPQKGKTLLIGKAKLQALKSYFQFSILTCSLEIYPCTRTHQNAFRST